MNQLMSNFFKSPLFYIRLTYVLTLCFSANVFSEDKQASAPNDLFSRGEALYKKSKPNSPNQHNALAMITKSADQGNVGAQVKLGEIYLNGDKIKTDTKKSFYWYQKAAEQNNLTAQKKIALMNKKGIGTDTNMKQAIYWWRQASEQGDAHSQLQLALAYSFGDGIKKNYEFAYAWASVSSESGSKHAKDLQRILVKNHLSQEALIRAQKLAEQWIETYKKGA